MAAALVVTVITGAHYVVKALRLRQTSERACLEAGWGGGPPMTRPEMRQLPAGLTAVSWRPRSSGRSPSEGETVAVAESLTGGLLTSALVDVPGASAVLRGGVVAYATDLKARLLGVDQGLLDEHGAVHPEVALAMAAGVRERLDATYGVATTGVAGPDAQDGHPPGTVYVAVSAQDRGGLATTGLLAGGRDDVRATAVLVALELLGAQLGLFLPDGYQGREQAGNR